MYQCIRDTKDGFGLEKLGRFIDGATTGTIYC